MPVNRIKISFTHLGVDEGADLWGEWMWMFTATIDGKPVGDPTQAFIVMDKLVFPFPPDWSAVVDVSSKTKLSDSVKVIFSGRDMESAGVTSSGKPLGNVSYEFKYPFHVEKTVYLVSPRKYTLAVKMKVVEVNAIPAHDKWTKGVKTSRQHDGSTTFTTVSGYQMLPRIEVCPVVPTPEGLSSMPPRPDYAANLGLYPGKKTKHNSVVKLWPLPDLNSTYNPSLIPVLSKTDPHFDKKVAKLAVTYVEPSDVDLSNLIWKVKNGPSEIVGSNKGGEIRLVGTGNGKTDELTEIGVYWGTDSGTLLATFRAWVGKIKTAKYRINLINGPDAASPGDQSVVFSPDDYKNQLLMARVLYWQAGIDLVPDTDKTTWDGARTTDPATGDPLPDGVFIVPVADATLTVNVDNFSATPCTRLNFRPGVLHVVYVCTTPSGRAAATDIQGVDGQPYKMAGSPSSSWVLPSGVPPDDPAGILTMTTFESSERLSLWKAIKTKGEKGKVRGDNDYVTARQAVDPKFTATSMGQLYAAVLPSTWTMIPGTGTDPNAGVNAAHELGHVLGLRHRGHTNQLATGPYLSDDGINCIGTDGKMRGHPWHENIMTYGYAGNTAGIPRAQDIDLLQTAVMRKHPAVK